MNPFVKVIIDMGLKLLLANEGYLVSLAKDPAEQIAIRAGIDEVANLVSRLK